MGDGGGQRQASSVERQTGGAGEAETEVGHGQRQASLETPEKVQRQLLTLLVRILRLPFSCFLIVVAFKSRVSCCLDQQIIIPSSSTDRRSPLFFLHYCICTAITRFSQFFHLDIAFPQQIRQQGASRHCSRVAVPWPCSNNTASNKVALVSALCTSSKRFTRRASTLHDNSWTLGSEGTIVLPIAIDIDAAIVAIPASIVVATHLLYLRITVTALFHIPVFGAKVTKRK